MLVSCSYLMKSFSEISGVGVNLRSIAGAIGAGARTNHRCHQR